MTVTSLRRNNTFGLFLLLFLCNYTVSHSIYVSQNSVLNLSLPYVSCMHYAYTSGHPRASYSLRATSVGKHQQSTRDCKHEEFPAASLTIASESSTLRIRAWTMWIMSDRQNNPGILGTRGTRAQDAAPTPSAGSQQSALREPWLLHLSAFIFPFLAATAVIGADWGGCRAGGKELNSWENLSAVVLQLKHIYPGQRGSWAHLHSRVCLMLFRGIITS